MQREINVSLPKREEPRKQQHAALIELTLRNNLKIAERHLHQVRANALIRFFNEWVSQLENTRRDGHQAGFYEHTKRLHVARKRVFTSQNIKGEDSKLLRKPTLTRERHAR